MSERSDTLLRYAEVSSLGFGGLLLTLHISDPELCAELEEYEEGRERHDFAVSALKIGTLALRHAKGRIDAERIREEGDRLVQNLALALSEH